MTVVLGVLALALAGCGTRGGGENAAASNANGLYKIGKPYQIGGAWYYPAVNWNYDQTGVASWYGPDFHGQYTANGERFDMNALTAAHRTLPLPSVVQVTNLANGRTVQLRINDRGPYARDRILDVSRRAAQLLGFESAGTARVRVTLLRQPTLQAQLLAQRNGGPGVEPPTQLAAAEPVTPVSAQTLTSPPASAAPSSAATPAASVAPKPRAATSRLALVTSAEAATPEPHLIKAPAAGGAKMYIQAGAFTRIENAKRLKARLVRFGTVKVDTARIGGVNVYRVRLGPIATTNEADRLLGDVIKSGVTQARLAFDR
ncbi:MAG: septal ring lytic transglycosylase RlpA family protein [Alphaproteobacteria bacterium]|nr:septal ring lytic transglycosylase RlpA family protein [Alphaproteobacteria bacterium]